MRQIISVLLGMVLLTVAFPATSADRVDAMAIERFARARVLFDEALGSGDLLFGLAAARMRDSVRAVPGVRKSTPVEPANEASSDPPLMTADVMFSTLSERIRNGDTVGQGTDYQKAAQRFLAEAIQSRKRGRVGGPVISRHQVPARGNITLEQRFEAAKVSIVYAEGPGTADIDMVIRDASGKVQCEDKEKTDRMLCRWIAPDASPARIEIINRDAAPHAILFISN
jgi:hypothetical protein